MTTFAGSYSDPMLTVTSTTAPVTRKPRKPTKKKAEPAVSASILAANMNPIAPCPMGTDFSLTMDDMALINLDETSIKTKKATKPRKPRAPKKDGPAKPRKPRQSKKKAAADQAAAEAEMHDQMYHQQHYGNYGSNSQQHQQYSSQSQYQRQQSSNTTIPIVVPPLDMQFTQPMSSAASPIGPLQWDFNGSDLNLDFSQADFASLGLDTDLFLQPGSTKHANQLATTPSQRYVMQQQQQQQHHQQQQQAKYTHHQHQRLQHMLQTPRHGQQMSCDTPSNSGQKQHASGHPFSQGQRRQGGARTAPGNALVSPSPIGPMPTWDNFEGGNLDRGMASLTLSMLESDFDGLGPGPKTDDSFGVNWAAGALNLPFSPT